MNRLNVDASFVMGIGKNRDDERIVEAVISLGHNMGLAIVAEGVETQEQLQFSVSAVPTKIRDTGFPNLFHQLNFGNLSVRFTDFLFRYSSRALASLAV